MDAWVGAPENSVAWLNTPEALEIAQRRGGALCGASPGVVERVHDKAFALDVARRQRLVPSELEETSIALESSLLAEPERAVRHIQSLVTAWPDWAKRSFTLKPRHGSSGRGRVGCTNGQVDTPALRGALPRLALRGGAILEPWLERRCDLSAQMHVQPNGDVTLLGTLEQRVSPAGGYLGHAGFIDARGRIHAGPPHDEDLREPAATTARAAAELGYTGPCGIDAFSFLDRQRRETLRPLCEFNARFTLGWVVIGLLKRALPLIREGIGILAEQRRAFVFFLAEPEAGWPRTDHRSDLQFIPLWRKGEEERPGFLVATDRDVIDAEIGGS